MKLEALLQAYPDVKLATSADNVKILDFYHQTQLNNQKEGVIYKRKDDFFALMKARSSQYLVFYIELDHEIKAMAAISYRLGFVEGKVETIGYLGDLRVSLHKKTIKIWRKFYKDLLKASPELEETSRCRYYFSALMHTNNKSNVSLVAGRIPEVEYKLIQPFKMHNYVGKFPFGIMKEDYKILQGPLTQKEKDFVSLDQKKKFFGLDFVNEYEYRNNNWKDLVYIKIYQEDKLVAITSTWNSRDVKTIQVTGLSSTLKLASNILSLLPGFKFKKAPEPKTDLDILYLNQFSFKADLDLKSKQAIFKSVLDFLYQNHFQDFQTISYANHENENIAFNGYPYFSEVLEMGIYQISHDSFDIKKGHLSDPLSFDMQLV
ncbi:MAG: hypothetical protein GY909_17080 [Oligoflexia bacterium]|nr:hypothetical protein [Oligoflexia bacterium]